MADIKDYLKIYGNIKHSRLVHVRVMKEKGLPFVNYSGFTSRVSEYGWDLYRAIHTPANVSHRTKARRRKVRWLRFKYNVKRFFRKLFNLSC